MRRSSLNLVDIFVRMVLCQPSWGERAINEAQELRVEGDYGAGTPDVTEVAAYVAKAEQFVAAVKSIVSGTAASSSG